MSKKYVIEIPDETRRIWIDVFGDGYCYTRAEEVDELEELNSDYINEHFGSLQDEAYQRGLEDAWEAAQKVVCKTTAGGMSLDTLKEIFGVQSPVEIMQSNTAQQAIDKIKTYEDKQKDRIEVGDEVSAEDGTSIFIVTWMSERCICGVDKEGRCYSYELSEICGKTGKHYDIVSILEAMRTHD